MLNRKAKGTAAERELIHMFWESGWAAFRAAGSGSTRLACPDVIAGNISRKIAVECKTTKNNKKYLNKKEVKELQEFSKIFGCEAWIAIRFNGKNWYFIAPEDLKENPQGYSASMDLLKTKGMLFEEMVNF